MRNSFLISPQAQPTQRRIVSSGQPATVEQVEAVRPLVSPLVRDLIDVQRLTGSRAGELLSLTPAKIDTTGNVWLFHVDGHKTEDRKSVV